jgi:uncharacterized protein with PIN domain
MKFLVDQMLGTLAKWLRLCGLDTYYASQHINDDELLVIAEKEHRILITRDKELHQRAKKKEISTLLSMSRNLSEQLDLLFQSYPKIIDELDPLSRCSLCNTQITPIEKNFVEQKVPKRIFQQHDHFWICPNCQQIYWKGTHYDKILATIEQLIKNNKKSKNE